MSDPHVAPGPRTEGARLIGSNALARIAAALAESEAESASAVLAAAGEPPVLALSLNDMVDERRVGGLVAAMVERLGERRAEHVLLRAGAETAEHLLANLIPVPFQWLLRRLPRDLALRLLLGGVANHATTFAGSGRLSYEVTGDGFAEVRIADCPVCRRLEVRAAICGFYVGMFERLFRKLVDDRFRVREVECLAAGDPCCTFMATADGQAS